MEIVVRKVVKKIVRSAVTLDKGRLRACMTTERDVDSTRFEIHYKKQWIGDGHLNNKTNTAHVTLFSDNKDNVELEDFLVDAIENRTILLDY